MNTENAQISNPVSEAFDTVLTSSKSEPSGIICQWIYNRPKYKKSGEPDYKRKRVGYIVAAKTDDGKIVFGWSKCAAKDVFNHDLARVIAYGRLDVGSKANFPSVFKPFMPEFVLRAKKYFQSDVVEDIVFA